jgi:hypothetical protein
MTEKYGAFQLMGMRCWKCHAEMGSLQLPEGSRLEELVKFLRQKKILPICENCIQTNPRFISGANATNGI